MIRMTPRISGIAAALLIGVMALTACGDSGSGGKSNADLLKEAAANMKAAKSYHLSADIDQAGTPVKMNGDLDLANKNYKLDLEASGQTISVIQVGGKGYLSMDGGKTYTESAEAAGITGSLGSFTDMWNTFEPAKVDAVKDALKDGTPATEKIDGVDTKHITANAKDVDLLSSLNATGTTTSTTEGTIEMWLGPDAKPYVRQMKLDITTDGKPTKGTLTWTKIDEALDIKAPATTP